MEENAKIKTIDEYIGTCSEEIQPKLGKLRKIILDASSELTEKISWGMPTFYFKGNVIHFAAHKKHIGLYCGAEAVKKFSDELQGYKTSKGTIQIPNDRELDAELVRNIVKFNVEGNRNKKKLENIYENTAWLYDYDNRDNLKDDIPFYNEYALKSGGEVLELGCGTGRVALRLAEAGIKVTGLDLSDTMLEIFREKLKNSLYKDNITLVRGNMAKFDLRKKFELIIGPFRAFQALTEEEDIISSLNCIRYHLADKGLFILNVFRPYKELDETWCYDEVVQWEVTDDSRGYKIVKKHWGDKIDIVDQIIYPHFAFEITDANGNIKRVEEHLKLKYYYYDQITKYLEKAGFSIEEEYGWYDKSNIEDGRELIFVCKKI